jgi:biotin synthase
VSVLIVTGTGTGVGKTVVTAAVAALARERGTRVAVVKPAQTGLRPGEPGDLAEVHRLAQVDDLHELARYPDPLSPQAAARLSPVDGLVLDDVARQVAALAADRELVLVEGAGGLLVRFAEDGWTVADLARLLDAPLLVVAAAGLGTLNHTALTLEVLAGRGLRLAGGVVVGCWPAEPDLAARSNVRDLEAVSGRPLGGALPAGAPGSLDFAGVARHTLGPEYGGRFDAADFRAGFDSGRPNRVDTYRIDKAEAMGGRNDTDRIDSLAAGLGRGGRRSVTDILDRDIRDSGILDIAREQVLERGRGLSERQAEECLRLPAEALEDLLGLAHQVRMRWCGPEVEVEGIVSVKTGGCPEDCHFCSQSGRFDSPVRAAWLDIPALVQAARATAATGATEFCIVAAVRGPDERLMAQVRRGVAAIREAVEINVACSLGILTPEQVEELAAIGVHRYNHNLETARSYFPEVVTTHTWEERFETLRLVREAGMEVCCGGIVGMGETLAQRAELAAQLAALAPDEVPLNFLNPRPGTPFAHLPVMAGTEALQTVATFRLVLPRTVLRYAGGREITLGDLAGKGVTGGINAVIVGNYLTTLGRPAAEDLQMLADLQMPIKALSQTL